MKKNKLALLILTSILFFLALTVVQADGGVDLTKCEEHDVCSEEEVGGNCIDPGYFCHTEDGENYCCQPEARTPLGKISLPSWLTWTRSHPGVSGINLLINNAVKLIFIVASVGLFMMFLWGGVNYIFSQGDKTRTESARNMITNALIGFTIVALSFAIMRVVEAFFGINIIGQPEKTAAHCIKPYSGDVIECQNECSGCSISTEAGFDRMCCPPAPSGCNLSGCIEWTKSATECNVTHGSECFVMGIPGNRSCCHP